MLQILGGIFGAFNPIFLLLVIGVLLVYALNLVKIKIFVDLWAEFVSVATTFWGQIKGNVLVLVIAGFLFLFDQRLFTIILAVTAIVLLVGDKVNEIVKSIKLPKV